MNFKKMASVVAGLLVIGAAGWLIYVLFVQSTPSTTQSTRTSEATSMSSGSSSELTPLVIGDPDAPVTIIEYGDYKCPECGKFKSDVGQRLREEYVDKGKVKIVFRP